MDERSFFDGLAPVWDANETVSTPERVAEVLDLMGVRRGERVLDLGTGTGVLLPGIAARVGLTGSVTAVDFSEGMLARAQLKFSGLVPKPDFLQADFETDVIPGMYDRIILYCVWPHLHDPDGTLRWLRAVNLARGGEIDVAFPSGPEFVNNVHRERHSAADVLPSAHGLAERLRSWGHDAEAVENPGGIYLVRISGEHSREDDYVREPVEVPVYAPAGRVR